MTEIILPFASQTRQAQCKCNSLTAKQTEPHTKSNKNTVKTFKRQASSSTFDVSSTWYIQPPLLFLSYRTLCNYLKDNRTSVILPSTRLSNESLCGCRVPLGAIASKNTTQFSYMCWSSFLFTFQCFSHRCTSLFFTVVTTKTPA